MDKRDKKPLSSKTGFERGKEIFFFYDAARVQPKKKVFSIIFMPFLDKISFESVPVGLLQCMSYPNDHSQYKKMNFFFIFLIKIPWILVF